MCRQKLTCKIQPKLGADRDVQLWADGLTGKDTVEVLSLYFRHDQNVGGLVVNHLISVINESLVFEPTQNWGRIT